VANTSSWWVSVTLGLLFGSPWLVASVYYLRKGIRDGAVQPSLGEQMRNRLLS
jgi:hypothetical protein